MWCKSSIWLQAATSKPYLNKNHSEAHSKLRKQCTCTVQFDAPAYLLLFLIWITRQHKLWLLRNKLLNVGFFFRVDRQDCSETATHITGTGKMHNTEQTASNLKNWLMTQKISYSVIEDRKDLSHAFKFSKFYIASYQKMKYPAIQMFAYLVAEKGNMNSHPPGHLQGCRIQHQEHTLWQSQACPH